MKRLLTILLLVPFLFTSCDKEELEEIEMPPQPTWQLHNGLLHEQRFINNLHSTSEDLFVMSLNLFSTITVAEGQEHVARYKHFFENAFRYIPPMSDNIFGEARGSVMHFRATAEPVTGGADLILDAKKLDPDFVAFSLVYSYHNESFSISDNDVALVPYRYFNSETLESGLSYFLVKMELKNTAQNYTSIRLKEALTVRPLENGGNVRLMAHHDSNFYVTTDWGLYKITEEGEINLQMPEQIVYSFFSHKRSMYTISRNQRTQSHGLFRSETGDSWSHKMHLSNIFERLIYYAISDDILLASSGSQIFEVTLGEDQIQVKELDNTGLDGHYITAVIMLKDKVYISTQSGLFSKNIEHLLTYKHQE